MAKEKKRKKGGGHSPFKLCHRASRRALPESKKPKDPVRRRLFQGEEGEEEREEEEIPSTEAEASEVPELTSKELREKENTDSCWHMERNKRAVMREVLYKLSTSKIR